MSEKNMPPRRRGRPGKPVTVHGVTYPSTTAACKALGMSMPTVYARIAKGMSREDALGTPPGITGGGHPTEVFGVTYPSMSEACRSTGVSIQTVYSRLARNLSLDEAFGPTDTPVPCEGYKDLETACWEKGLNYVQTYRLVKGGMTFEEVLAAAGVKS